MSQLTINTTIARTPRERIRTIARAMAPYAVVVALIAAWFVERLVAIAVANREVMQAFHEMFLRVATAMGLAG